MNSRLTRILMRTEPTLLYILTFFVNFLMHSGLRVSTTYTNGTKLTLFPQFVPNTCAKMEELTGRRDTWPCHREAMLTWIRQVRKGEDAEFWDFATLVFVVVMFIFHIFALIWTGGTFPNAEWRRSDWLPPSCANGKARREREEKE
ncbi:hypothetical protein TI39_contig372g00012 [Zymoseptoria brevis]|uniref:Uncharacterized protein n=1 Tax=Zymoseptoria brevis TaxID=1047168 RepID=A0A0F4GSG0_9PEZI|nr:hypothetical protein TI39_contig372g00012 [Zymoseptoria brevis]